MTRIDFDTLVGLGVAEDAARSIMNDLSMRRMQAAESGVEIDDELTLENLTGLGMSEEQARGLVNDAAQQRLQMRENQAATDAQRAAIAQAAAEADELAGIRQQQRAQLGERMPQIEANLAALNIARMADAGQLVPGAEQTDPERVAAMNIARMAAAGQLVPGAEATDSEQELLRRQAAAIASGQDMMGEPLVAGAEATDSPEQIALRQQYPGMSPEQIQAAELRKKQLTELQDLRAKAAAGQQTVDSMYNRAAIQALMGASQPIAPRTFGEAMSGKPATAQAEMQQNINLARQFFGRQGTVQRERMKAAEAERRMRRFRASQKQKRELAEARAKAQQERFEASERRKTEAAVAKNEVLLELGAGKIQSAADRLDRMTALGFARLAASRENNALLRQLKQTEQGRKALKGRAGDIRVLLQNNQANLSRISREIKDANDAVQQARFALSFDPTLENEAALENAQEQLRKLTQERSAELADQAQNRIAQRAVSEEQLGVDIGGDSRKKKARSLLQPQTQQQRRQ